MCKEELENMDVCPDSSFGNWMEITLECTEIGAATGYNLMTTSSFF